ncbi:MAG: heme ABC transporter ATP-binding protein [Candidatus Nanopelagicales bacterium]
MISAKNVQVDRGARTVVKHATFGVEPGRCIALVGPNGCGKSTLVAALCGDVPIAAGSVQIDGLDVSTGSAGELARRRSVMTQQTQVAFGFTVREVVAMGRTPWRGEASATDDDVAIGRALADVDLLQLADRPVQALSGGELSRVAMARVLAQGTNTLILDEPTAALDLRHQVGLLDCVKARTREGAAALVVLHDLTLAADFADEVLVMSEGQMIAKGSPEEVIRPSLLSQVYGVEVVTVTHPVTGRPIVVPVSPMATVASPTSLGSNSRAI